MGLSRRKFLVGATSLLAAPHIARANGTTDYDVVIIGAGAAGLAAAEVLQGAGKSVILLEATDRIGGRAQTDTAIFGVPCDLGAHWLHYDTGNFFKAYAQRFPDQFHLRPSPDEYAIFIGDRWATPTEVGEFEAAYESAQGVISDWALDPGTDDNPKTAIDDAAPQFGDWDASVRFAIGPWEMAKELDRFSALDWSSTEDSFCDTCVQDWLCAEGHGALLAHYARSVLSALPAASLKLSTPVSAVELDGDTVTVEWPKGSVSASACIVTVSMGVLAAGAIRFEPQLPSAKQTAFQKLTMGHYNRVVLQFSSDALGVGSDVYLFERLEAPGGHPIGYTCNIAGRPIVYCDVGAQTALDLEQMTSDAAVDFALAGLKRMFGNAIAKQLVKGHATAWTSNPYTRGAYASPVPGARRHRSALTVPVEDRIFFAGEACHRSKWGTVGGAHDSGECVAKFQVLPSLAGDPVPLRCP